MQISIHVCGVKLRIWLELLVDKVTTVYLQRVAVVHLAGYKAVRRRCSEGLSGFHQMDKQACKSIICHADNATEEISPPAFVISFHWQHLWTIWFMMCWEFHHGLLQIYSVFYLTLMFDFVLDSVLFWSSSGQHFIEFFTHIRVGLWAWLGQSQPGGLVKLSSAAARELYIWARLY